MYPFSVSDFPIPGRGILYILIIDLTAKSTLVLLTLLSVSKPHLENHLAIVNPIKGK